MTCEYCTSYSDYLKSYDNWTKGAYSFGNTTSNYTNSGGAFSLRPAYLANGGFQYTDENGHGQFKLMYHANGAPIVNADSRDIIQVINGRSELDRTFTRMRDQVFLND